MAELPSSGTLDPQSTVAPSPATYPDPITLQVGEQRFTTKLDTLTHESKFFSIFFSDQWRHAQPDGSYFVDADGELFQDILRYLRRGVPPVYYSPDRGHDYPRYLANLEEARYFQIDRLVKWLTEKTYLKVYQIEYSVEVVIGTDTLDRVVSSNEEVEYHPAWDTEKVYVCPRGIPVHKGNPRACGRQCMNARGDAEAEYSSEKVLKMAVIRKKTIFNQDLCLDGR